MRDPSADLPRWWAHAVDVAARWSRGALTQEERAHVSVYQSRSGPKVRRVSAWLQHRLRLAGQRYLSAEDGRRLDALGVPLRVMLSVVWERSRARRQARLEQVLAEYSGRPRPPPSPLLPPPPVRPAPQVPVSPAQRRLIADAVAAEVARQLSGRRAAGASDRTSSASAEE